MRQKPLNIGVDLMGSDNALSMLIDSVLQFAPSERDISFYLFGTQEVKDYISKVKVPSNVTFISVKEAIEMDENPLIAIRRKKDSSVCVGMKYLRDDKIDAFISSGNTGALVSAAKTIVGMKKNILRPALLAWIPTRKNPFAILDVGANVNVKPIHLVQFAKMGIDLYKSKKNFSPKVGLLNIGSEKLKGTTLLQETYKELISLQDKWGFKFEGNIEGKDAFQGSVDVLITDGFTGNIFLKTSEGVASFILDRMGNEMPNEISSLVAPYLKDLKSHLHYAQYPGAVLIGIKKLVIKCHSYSSSASFVNGIKDAISQKILESK